MALYAKLATAFPADPKVAMAGPMAELLYIRAMLHCREHLTDGVIHVALLPRVGLGIPGDITELANTLVEVGLWGRHEHGYVIPDRVWRAWNPTADEVEQQRHAEAERKASYRRRTAKPQVNGHEQDSPPSVDDNGQPCPENVPPGHQRHATQPRRNRDGQPEPEPEPEPEPVLVTAPAPATAGEMRARPAAAAAAPSHDDLADTIDLAVAAQRRTFTGRVRNEQGWKRSVRERITTDHTPALAARLAAGDDPAQAVAHVLEIPIADVRLARHPHDNPSLIGRYL